MPYRRIVFANNEIYHVLNRSIEQITIFKERRDFERILEAVDFYRYVGRRLSFSHYKNLSIEARAEFWKSLKKKNEVLVEVLTFCLMSNHFHLLLRQKIKNGISIFMKNLQNSYVRYFNTKYDRVGGLFQSMFKAIRIETDEQLLHVSRYIHLNPVTAYLIEIGELENYPWSSFPEYLKKGLNGFTNSKPILDFFESGSDYKKFVFDQADYQRELAEIKSLTLES